jgi:hypothetical protein
MSCWIVGTPAVMWCAPAGLTGAAVYGIISELLASGTVYKILVQYVVGTSPKLYLKKKVFIQYYTIHIRFIK